MQLYSTNNKENIVDLKEAVFKGLPEDKGLFMPSFIPKLPQSFIDNIESYSFQEIGFEITKALFQGYLPDKAIRTIINKAINFPAPIVQLDKSKGILELFHGPSLAFKDFGARFMAQLMSYFNQDENDNLVILVATSGDTGGAVAAGFYNTPGIEVIILYPSGKVSLLQEKQLTTLGKNITALEIDGSFDDCQALVKHAFSDPTLTSHIRLSSANSINIARLIPQSFYYFEAFKQVKKLNKEVVFCIPSGNFGNLTAGLLAKEMGLPAKHFIAATNVNDVVPEYLTKGEYKPRPSIRTLSNAMDVGSPSNFARMLDLYHPSKHNECSTWNTMTQDIIGAAYTDEQTKEAVKEVYAQYNYIIDPHGAVGYLALKDYQNSSEDAANTFGVIFETAHPSKFIDSIQELIPDKISIPQRLAILKDKKKEAHHLSKDFNVFKDWLSHKYNIQ